MTFATRALVCTAALVFRFRSSRATSADARERDILVYDVIAVSFSIDNLCGNTGK